MIQHLQDRFYPRLRPGVVERRSQIQQQHRYGENDRTDKKGGTAMMKSRQKQNRRADNRTHESDPWLILFANSSPVDCVHIGKASGSSMTFIARAPCNAGRSTFAKQINGLVARSRAKVAISVKTTFHRGSAFMATNNREKPPKAIFFDAAGTLFHFTGTVGHHYALVGMRWALRSMRISSMCVLFSLEENAAPRCDPRPA